MQNVEKLLEIMRALRDPETGCPWDQQQDFSSIAAWTLEEAYEVLEAINHGNYQGLRDELGDLLFQVVYHAQMASEQDQFEFSDVVDSINDKLIRRHPHVFGDEVVNDAEEQSRRWHRIKDQEQAEPSETGDGGLLAGVSPHQPALRRAEKLQLKAASVGFDWDNFRPIFAKVREELAELECELEQGEAQDRIRDECGDLLFVMVNLARKLGINPELALGRANQKFIRRFGFIEQQLAASQRTPEDASLEEMDRLWELAKQHETGD